MNKPVKNFRGVTQDKASLTWKARLIYNGQDIIIRNLASQAEAIKAYDKLHIIYKGKPKYGTLIKL